jgi:purine-binding chemotaxis protein CheW
VDALFQVVVFTLHEQLYALRLACVDRIVRIVEITALPSAPDIVLGVVNIQGRVVPVVDLRKRFGLSPREVELADNLIIARTSRRPVALLVAAVKGVVECSQAQVIAGEGILANAEGVLKLEDGMALINDLDSFLSPLEDRELSQALGNRASGFA